MAEIIVVLSGGSRDGESTVVDSAVDRLYAASDAPGLLDVYETTGQTRPLAGNTEPATVFAFAGQASAEGMAPEAIHMPTTR
ncbi:MAG: hypothetical protein ACJ735_11675 [Actinomycetes bacterium]